MSHESRRGKMGGLLRTGMVPAARVLQHFHPFPCLHVNQAPVRVLQPSSLEVRFHLGAARLRSTRLRSASSPAFVRMVD